MEQAPGSASRQQVQPHEEGSSRDRGEPAVEAGVAAITQGSLWPAGAGYRDTTSVSQQLDCSDGERAIFRQLDAMSSSVRQQLAKHNPRSSAPRLQPMPASAIREQRSSAPGLQPVSSGSSMQQLGQCNRCSNTAQPAAASTVKQLLATLDQGSSKIQVELARASGTEAQPAQPSQRSGTAPPQQLHSGPPGQHKAQDSAVEARNSPGPGAAGITAQQQLSSINLARQRGSSQEPGAAVRQTGSALNQAAGSGGGSGGSGSGGSGGSGGSDGSGSRHMPLRQSSSIQKIISSLQVWAAPRSIACCDAWLTTALLNVPHYQISQAINFLQCAVTT
jgi:hypothetical protein